MRFPISYSVGIFVFAFLGLHCLVWCIMFVILLIGIKMFTRVIILCSCYGGLDV